VVIISIPSSIREGPRTTNTLAKKRYLIVYFAIIILSAQPAIIWFWYFYQFFPEVNLLFFILFPFAFFVGFFVLIFSSLIFSKIFLFVINLFHKPKEGVFNRDKKDKDYCYWSLRAVIKKWPFWLIRQLNLPVLEILALKILGVKTSFSNSLSEGWIDCEFIELGKNVKIGQGSVIMSNIIVKNKIIVKKVIIKDNIIIGAHCCIAPGTIIESNTILGANSMTILNQHIIGYSVYNGSPAEKIMENEPIGNKIMVENEIFDRLNEIKCDDKMLRAESKDSSVPYQAYIISGTLIIGGSYVIPGLLFFLYFYGFLIPNLLTIPFSFKLLFSFKILIILFLTPIIFIWFYLLHLFFIALLTRLFYRFADKRGPAQGIFDRNLSEHSKILDYYHFRSFLMKYPIFSIIRSPFPWLINWELRFIGSNKVGKGTVIEESYLHSHINFGKNCYYGTFAHISNHLVDGVYGKENLTFFGAQIGDNCVFNSLTGGMPGLDIGDDSTFLLKATSIKYDKLGDNGIYAGFPLRRLTKEEIKEILGGEYDEE